jgi:ABC-type glycerol-3-phosphate transport system permease component
MRNGNKIHQKNSWIADTLIHALFILVCLIMLYPFLHVIMASLMQYDEYFSKSIYLWVEKPTFDAYKIVWNCGKFLPAMKNTIGVTVLGTVFSLFVTAVAAYGLSKKFPGRKGIMTMIIITMFFNGGIIPQYIMFKQMGLLDNYLVFILPATVNAFNLIILRTHYINFPVEIEEAARIDGCQDFGIFIRIVLPLSVPMLITIGLFYAVSYWNTFFRSMFFITKDQMRMLQDYLYRILKAQDAED